MSECVCMGFSINRRCSVHGNPEVVFADEAIRVQRSISGDIDLLKRQLCREKQLREELEKKLIEAEKVIEFYADTKDYSDRGRDGVWCSYADDYSQAMGRLIEDDGKRAGEYNEKHKDKK